MLKGKKLFFTDDFTPDVAQVVNISDSNGQVIQISDAAGNKGKQLPSKINVTLEATHTGVNRNKVNYAYDKLERSVDSWTENYNKPVLLNHDSSSDPLGRVLNGEFKQSAINPGKHCIQLSVEITNKDAIERFLDGRYRTFSIGGYTDSAVCSICGKDLMQDGYCGHQRGKKYDGKECYWNLGTMEYDEISVVNCPADVHAQALTVQTFNEDGQADAVIDLGVVVTDSENNAGTKVTDGVDPTILDNIDGIVGNQDGTEPPTNDPVPPVADNTPTEPTEPTQPTEPTEPPTGEQGDKVKELEDKIKALEEDKVNLTEQLAAKDGVIAQKDIEIETLSTERDSVKAELEVANTESKGLMDKNVSLAKATLQIMASNVANLQIALGDKTLEDKEGLVKEYSTYTSKRLNDMILELVKPEKITQRKIVLATNPGVISDGDTIDGTGKQTDNTELNAADYVESMIKFMVK